MKTDSVMFFIANKRIDVVRKYAGLIRTKLGEKCELIDKDRFEFCIINDFPMFSWDYDKRKWEFCHNPFSLPHTKFDSSKEEEVKTKFKSIFTAFKYGCPPHGGMAPGIDRIIMLLTGEDNLREVQAFPTSSSGADLMMGSPSSISDKQLKELGIKII